MGNGSILLVEDNRDDEVLTRRAFQKGAASGELVVVHSGSEALDYLFGTGGYAGRDTRVMPRVVLLDLHLPGMDGLEILRRLRSDKRTQSLPVVVLSASDDPGDIVGSYALGANSYIRKPAGFGQLVEVLQLLSRYWVELNVPSPWRAG